VALEVPPPSAVPGVAPDSAPGFSIVSLGLLVVSVAFSLAGQLTLKSAMTRIGRIGAADVAAPVDTIARAAREPRLWLGLVAFGVSAVFWLIVLSRVPLSVAYPFVGISYVGVVALSRIVLHEQVPVLRWIGALVVALGIVIVGLSFRRAGGF
jgi:multidrug transporter EmrE-like cation transporter